MVQEIDKIPYGEITKLGQATRYVIKNISWGWATSFNIILY